MWKTSGHTIYYKFGWIALLTGIFIMVAQILIYLFVNHSELELVTYTGTAFTVAGLFFVLDNLTLQKEAIHQQKISIDQQNTVISLQKDELKNQIEELRTTNAHFDAQNKTLLNQQYQTTFFSLLSNHTTLIGSLSLDGRLGIEGWSYFYDQVSQRASQYRGILEKKRFMQYSHTEMNPFYLLETNKHSIESALSDFITIVRLIDERLSEEVYYDITHNYLTVYEKYLIGFYCDCYENEQTRFIKTHKHKFLKYYNSHPSKYSISVDNYFPGIVIERSRNKQFRLMEIDDSSDMLDFYLSISKDIYSNPLVLDSIKVHTYYIDYQNNTDKTQFDKLILVEPKIVLKNWLNRTKLHLIPYVRKKLIGLENNFYAMDIIFNFTYLNNKFEVVYHTSVTLSEYKLNDFEKDRMFQITHER